MKIFTFEIFRLYGTFGVAMQTEKNPSNIYIGKLRVDEFNTAKVFPLNCVSVCSIVVFRNMSSNLLKSLIHAVLTTCRVNNTHTYLLFPS